ncbi:MAG: ABC-F family ATP-binding cassette domain-containing protein [Phycisphaerales bacterium]
MLINAQNISRTLGTREVFHSVSLTINEGDRAGLIGPNGAGKSTLLRVLAAIDPADAGSLTITKGTRAAFVPQHDHFPADHTPRQIVIDAATRSSESLARDHHEGEIAADIALSIVGFSESQLAEHASALSGGWRKRLSIAAALAATHNEPDLILLDEPTNHLDLEGIAWLERFLTGRLPGVQPFASVFVTHDRAFLERIATRIIELSAAYPAGTLAVDGNYTEFIRRKGEFLDAQAKAEQAAANQVRKDLAWLARGAKARRTKEKGRISASHARMESLGELRERNAAAGADAAGVSFSGTDRRTRKLIVAKGIAKSFAGRTLFSGLDLILGAGECLALLGPNGSGKTTLIRILTSELAPDTGTITLADPPPRIVVFSQHRQDFEPTTLLRDALSPASDQVHFRGQSMHVTGWAKRFLFKEHQLAQPVKSLSGGELARIHIARIMLQPADVLVLDEPTNDLDIPTLEIMEEALEDFPGALVLVTHDRAMVDRLATDILAIDGRGGTGRYASVEQAVAAMERTPDPAPTRAPKDRDDRPDTQPTTPSPAPATPPQRRKLSYKDQREYDQIEQRILEAEAAAEQAERTLSNMPSTATPQQWTDASTALAEAQAAVAALYTRWEQLEAMRG